MDATRLSRLPSRLSGPSSDPATSAGHGLWRLQGATDELRALAVETSFGYALVLELDRERILLLLQPSLETLVAYADRIEAALLAQGWQRLPDTPSRSLERP